MNPNTGEIRRFRTAEEAREAGFTIPVGGSPFDQAEQARPVRRDVPAYAEVVATIDRASVLSELEAENRGRARRHRGYVTWSGHWAGDGVAAPVTRQQRRRAERGLVKELMKAV